MFHCGEGVGYTAVSVKHCVPGSIPGHATEKETEEDMSFIIGRLFLSL